jgi:hypothetical protein
VVDTFLLHYFRKTEAFDALAILETEHRLAPQPKDDAGTKTYYSGFKKQ